MVSVHVTGLCFFTWMGLLLIAVFNNAIDTGVVFISLAIHIWGFWIWKEIHEK